MTSKQVRFGLPLSHFKLLKLLANKLWLDKTNTMRYCITRIAEQEGVLMIEFPEVYAALTEGKRVRRKRWDRDSVLFIQNGQLIWECHGRGTAHQLDWNDMTAKDWSINS